MAAIRNFTAKAEKNREEFEFRKHRQLKKFKQKYENNVCVQKCKKGMKSIWTNGIQALMFRTNKIVVSLMFLIHQFLLVFFFNNHSILSYCHKRFS